MDEYLKLAYQSAVEDIRFFKRQQWMVTNYAILIYGAMIAIGKLTPCIISWWLSVVIGLIGVFSFFLNILLQRSTQKARNRLDETIEILHERKKGHEETNKRWDWLDKYSVLILLEAVIFIGGIFAILVLSILKQQP
jgi:hypothetical protein